jgi:DUF4097 and DUF4098 domain-containing protein YvlB
MILLLCAAPAASAQDRPYVIEVKSDVSVNLQNTSGSITVTAWDRNEVAVMGSRAVLRNVQIDGSPERVNVQMHSGAQLEVRVPRQARLRANSGSGSVRVEGVDGSVDIESASGSLHVEGTPRSIHAQGFSGGITILGGGREVTRAETVSGTVTVTRASGIVEAKSSSGGVNVRGNVSEAVLFSVSGSVVFDGVVAGNGRMTAESSSGSVELTLPRNTSARYELSTVSADIENSFGPPATRAKSGAGVSLAFTVGNGGARIKGASVSGSVILQGR